MRNILYLLYSYVGHTTTHLHNRANKQFFDLQVFLFLTCFIRQNLGFLRSQKDDGKDSLQTNLSPTTTLHIYTIYVGMNIVKMNQKKHNHHRFILRHHHQY